MTRPWLAVILLAIISGNLENIYALNDVDVSRIIDLLKIVESDDLRDREFCLTFIQSTTHKIRDAKSNDASGITTKELEKLKLSMPLWSSLINKMDQIDEIYNSIKNSISNIEKDKLQFHYEELMNLSTIAWEQSSAAIPACMKHIHEKVDYYFEHLRTDKNVASQICFENQTPQQFLFSLYKMIAVKGIKGSVALQFSSISVDNNEYASNALIKTVGEYNRQTKETLKAMKSAMAVAPREFWRCDPSVHKEDSTYTELKEFIQGYVINEVDMSSSESCKETCDWYRHTWDYGCYDHKLCSHHRRCKGKVRDCRYLNGETWVCPSGNRSSRYQYIEYRHGERFGSNENCHETILDATSWNRVFVECSYCWCYCVENDTGTERYFSLKETTSHVEKNRVVTGIKLTKINRVIHLQIQEGKLMPRGEIRRATVQWKEVDKFTVMDNNVKNGIDYHTLDWENRALDLDDLPAPESHLLTGVRFKLIDTHLRLEIRVTPFEFATGLLMKTSTWLSAADIKDPAAMKEARKELVLTRPDVPTRLKIPTLPDSKPYHYLKFGTTDFKKDVSQTTIPFLDIQPLVTNPPFPLAGAGIFHKGIEGSGGFVALRVKTYDFSNDLNIDELTLPDIGVIETPAV